MDVGSGTGEANPTVGFTNVSEVSPFCASVIPRVRSVMPVERVGTMKVSVLVFGLNDVAMVSVSGMLLQSPPGLLGGGMLQVKRKTSLGNPEKPDRLWKITLFPLIRLFEKLNRMV